MIIFKYDNASGYPQIYQAPVFTWDGYISPPWLKVRVIGQRGKLFTLFSVGTGGRHAIYIDEPIPSDDYEFNVPVDVIGLQQNSEHTVDLMAEIRDDRGNFIEGANISILPQPDRIPRPEDYFESYLPNEFEFKRGKLIIVDIQRQAAFEMLYVPVMHFPSTSLVIPRIPVLMMFVATYDEWNNRPLDTPMAIAYYFDLDKGEVKQLFNVKGEYVFLDVVVQYKSDDDLRYIVESLTGRHPFFMERIWLNPSLTLQEKVKLMAPFVVANIFNDFSNKVIYADIDEQNRLLKLTIRIHIGDPDWDWVKLGLLLAGVALVVLGFFTFGATTPKGAFLIGLGTGIAVTTGYHAIVENVRVTQQIIYVYRQIDFKFDQAKKDISSKFKEVADFVDKLAGEGKIDAETRNMLIDTLNKLQDFVVSKIDELYNETVNAVSTAYNIGYKAGYDEGKKGWQVWIPVSFVGGVLVGVLLGQRVVITTR